MGASLDETIPIELPNLDGYLARILEKRLDVRNSRALAAVCQRIGLDIFGELRQRIWPKRCEALGRQIGQTQCGYEVPCRSSLTRFLGSAQLALALQPFVDPISARLPSDDTGSFARLSVSAA